MGAVNESAAHGETEHELDGEARIHGPCTQGCGMYDDGVETMRIACRDAVQAALLRHGYHDSDRSWLIVMSAIEEAAPRSTESCNAGGHGAQGRT